MNIPTTAPVSAGLAPTAQYPQLLPIVYSGGGCRVQADLKTSVALGCFCTTGSTALTAQNTAGARAIHAVLLDMQVDQTDAVVRHIDVDTVNTTTLHSASAIETVGSSTFPTSCGGHWQQATACSSGVGSGPLNRSFESPAHAAAGAVVRRHWSTVP